MNFLAHATPQSWKTLSKKYFMQLNIVYHLNKKILKTYNILKELYCLKVYEFRLNFDLDLVLIKKLITNWLKT